MFGNMPVEFVPEGMTAEEARRNRKRQRVTFGQLAQAMGALLALVIIFGAPLWWFFGRPDESQAQGTETTQAALKPTRPAVSQFADGTPTGIATGLPQPTPITPTPTATAGRIIITPTLTAASAAVTPNHVETLFNSPVVVVVTATPTSSPTPSPSPSPTPAPGKRYEVIYQAEKPEELYSYISGWVVEQDGVTPRPVALTLRHATGAMYWPRPGNRDIATGYYEFMVSPGEYWLDIRDSDLGPVNIVVGDTRATRYETSFRYTRADRLVTAAVSQPWAGDDPPLLTTTATPSPVPTTAKTRLYLPLVCR